MSATKKKSAFSVYAENPNVSSDSEKKIKDSFQSNGNGNNKQYSGANSKFKNGNQHQGKNFHHSKNNKNFTHQKNFNINKVWVEKNINKTTHVSKHLKKEKNKYAKLPAHQLTESITLFANGSNSGKFASKEFQTIKTKPETKKKHEAAIAKKMTVKRPANSEAKNKNQPTKKAKGLIDIPRSLPSSQVSGESLPFLKDSNEYQIDPEMFDSTKEALHLFEKITHPVKSKEFFKNNWEAWPLLIKRKNPDFYKTWFSCKEFDHILRNHNLEFTQNIDVTTYVNGVKQNHNPEGKAYAPLVWDYFQQGCSIRLLNPGTYSKNIWKYLSLLQEYFGTCVGANTYLTPAGTQGFAPHYDDIEAFVLQLEGKKKWKVYKPRSKDEFLPRFSSQNFTQADLDEPLIDIVLEAGDLLYFPRGYIHQATACDDIHSLHITVSCYQQNSWGDFLNKLMPGAIEIAMQENVEFRQGLPINYLLNNGIAYDNENATAKRREFILKTTELAKKLVKYLPIDSAVDQMAKRFIHESLPPCLTEAERERSIHGHGERWNEEKNRVEQIGEIEPDTGIKLIRRNCLRLVVEEDTCRIYYNLNNSKIFCEKEAQYVEVDTDAAPAVEFLIRAYPKYVTVEELPLSTIDDRIMVAAALYDKGLLITGEPLCQEDESSEEDGEEEDEEIEDDSKGEEEDEDDVRFKIANTNGVGEEDEDENADDDDDEEEDSDGFNSEEYDNFNNGDNQVDNLEHGENESDDEDNDDDGEEEEEEEEENDDE